MYYHLVDYGEEMSSNLIKHTRLSNLSCLCKHIQHRKHLNGYKNIVSHTDIKTVIELGETQQLFVKMKLITLSLCDISHRSK